MKNQAFISLRNRLRLAAVSLLCLAGASVQATPLFLVKAEPDITAFSPSIFEYDAGTQDFTIGSNGGTVALSYQPNLVDPTTAFLGTWELNASVDNNDVLTGGSLVITNNNPLNLPSLPAIPANSTLLEVALTDIGFQFLQQSPTELIGAFEFLGDTVSSEPVLGYGSRVGIIVGSASFGTGVGGIQDVNNPFAASFAANDPTDAVSDTFAVPTPAPLLLLLLGAGGIFWSKRRAQGQPA